VDLFLGNASEKYLKMRGPWLKCYGARRKKGMTDGEKRKREENGNEVLSPNNGSHDGDGDDAEEDGDGARRISVGGRRMRWREAGDRGGDE
jgi:hypothetical protein